MIRGLFTAASGMLAGERRQDIISNNLANVNTTGYKADTSIMRAFPEMLLYSLNDHTGSGPQAITPGMPNAGSVGTGAFLEETLTRFTPGTLKATSNKYDFAIIDVYPPDPRAADYAQNKDRRTFFAYNDDNGDTLVSRDGELHVNTDGYLVNASGRYVQAVDNNGVPVKNSKIQVNNQTNLLQAVDANGNIIRAENPATGDMVRFTVDVNNVNDLRDSGGGMYLVQPGNLLAASGEPRRGFTEASNVDVASTMTDMITVMRTYEANQHVIKTLDSTLDKAVNSLGRL